MWTSNNNICGLNTMWRKWHNSRLYERNQMIKLDREKMFDPAESDLYSYFILRYKSGGGGVLERYLSPKETTRTYLNLLDRRMVDPKHFTILFGHLDMFLIGTWSAWISFCLDKAMINCFTLRFLKLSFHKMVTFYLTDRKACTKYLVLSQDR